MADCIQRKMQCLSIFLKRCITCNAHLKCTFIKQELPYLLEQPFLIFDIRQLGHIQDMQAYTQRLKFICWDVGTDERTRNSWTDLPLRRPANKGA